MIYVSSLVNHCFLYGMVFMWSMRGETWLVDSYIMSVG